jgi:serine protease inhibitor
MVLASALYFRGKWKDAFNTSQTRTEPFFDDEDNKLADVDMMYQIGNFRMSFIEVLSCLALELPYSVSQ